jgi:dTDP-4-amino-4,6-dideoxygalactose transaminase
MIRMNDFAADPPSLLEAEVKSVDRVLKSGWYVLGREVEQFETEWAGSCGVDHAVGVGNGMDAIEIALRALNIGPGDEVVTTGMTAFATVLAVLRAGATPVLADIDPQTAILDPDSVERCLSPKTRAVLLVHLYGQITSMDRWVELSRSAKIALIEDCAQAHLARWNGRVAGAHGAAGAYSFYPTKNLGAAGDGGALITTSEDLAKQARILRNYGQSERYHHPYLGLNSRLDEIHAAMLLERLKWLERFTERRRQIASTYHAEIRNPQVTPLARPVRAENHVYHLFVLNTPKRDALAAHLRACGIESFVHYPIPVHRQKSCASLRLDPRGVPNTEFHARTCLSLPCHHNMTEEQAARVAESVSSFA